MTVSVRPLVAGMQNNNRAKLLAAALGGAFLVFAVGFARTLQLRVGNRRSRKRAADAEATHHRRPESRGSRDFRENPTK